MKLQHIVVASDLSTESLRPFRPVAELAREAGARVSVLHVVHELRALPYGAPLAPPIASISIEEECEEARAALERQLEGHFEGIDCKAQVISGEDVPRTLIGFAVEHDADVIAVSTHGRTGLRHLALGSVSEAILRLSEIPVLSFHRPKP